MTTPTTKLELSKPLGNEVNNRAAFNTILDQIDAGVMKDSLYCKSAVYNSGTSKIDVTFSPGVAMFLQTVVNKSVDSVYSISAPSNNTSYYIYLSNTGVFSHNTTGIEVDGAIMLWKVSTGAAFTTISTLDLRGIVNGSAQMVKDLLDAHQIASDPHPQYSLNTNLASHKNAATLDHPDGSVTDMKIGSRTIDDNVAAATGADTPTRLWSKLGNMIKQITGGAAWYTAPVTTIVALFAKFHVSTGHGHTGTGTDGPLITSSGLASGAATDAVIGNRSIVDTIAAASGADTPTNLFSKLGYMIRSITGGANWYTAPTTTLAALLTAVGLRAPINNAVFTGTTTLGQDPAFALQAATKQYVDATSAGSTVSPTALNLVYGQQVVTASKASPFNVINVCGWTLVNLLGRDGGCEDTLKFSVSNATLAQDSTTLTTGVNSLKVTSAAIAACLVRTTASYTITNTKYYLAAVDLKNFISSTSVSLRVDKGSNSLPIKASGLYTGTVWNTSFLTLSPTDLTGETSVKLGIVLNSTAIGQIANLDSFRLIEISSAEKTAIDAMNTANAQAYIANKYPYVDDVKHVNSPYINRIGENLLPPFNDFPTLHANATLVEPYKLTLAATANSQFSFVNIPLIAGQQYTFTAIHNGKTAIDMLNADFSVNVGSNVAWTTSNTYSFIAPSGVVWGRIYIGNDTLGAGTFTFTNPRLNIGSIDKGFKPRNDDYLYFPNQSLASSLDNTIFDQLFSRDGKWFKETRFVKDFVLDGNLAWNYWSDATGYKQLIATGVFPLGVFGTVGNRVVKSDGKILSEIQTIVAADQHLLWSAPSAGSLFISAADIDTGFGETFNTPSSSEVSAYFNGWKMNNGTFGTPYNGSGTKTWTLWNATNNTGSVTVVPTTQAAGYTPYKITYQLAVPNFEEIAFEGSISTLEGGNQIEVGNGIIVREKVTPYFDGGNYYSLFDTRPLPINAKFKLSYVIAIYKNGLKENQSHRTSLPTQGSGWALDYTDSVTYGKVKPVLYKSDYDPSALYEVTYLALDQYALTSNIQTINCEYNSNIKTVVDSTVQNVSDINTRVSIMENNKARKVQGQSITPTLLAGWVNYGVPYTNASYYKDEFGNVYFEAMIKNGTITQGTVIAVLPIGYRPLSQVIRTVLANSVLAYIEVSSSGNIVAGSGLSSTYTNISFAFRAEQ